MAVITRTLSNRAGIALVTLIVIITMVGVLGASIISFMGMKQRSYPMQAQSYQAFNIAHAGAEFAMRYVSDNGSIPAALKNGMTLSFGGGTFAIQYEPSGYPTYALRSIGSYGNARRELRIDQFPGYCAGAGLVLTTVIDPSVVPVQGCIGGCPESGSANKFTSIPVTNVFGVPIYIRYMEVTGPSGSLQNRLDNLYLNGSAIYAAAGDKDNPNYVMQGSKDYICIPGPAGGCSVKPTRIPYGSDWNIQLPPGGSAQILHFSSASINGNYSITFHFDLDTSYANEKTVTLSFTIS